MAVSPDTACGPSSQIYSAETTFGRDESFQLFIQEVDDILDTPINSLPARALRCFKTVKTLLAPCLNWEAVLRSMFSLVEVFQ